MVLFVFSIERNEISTSPLITVFDFVSVLLEVKSKNINNFTTCLDTRQPGTVFKKLDTRQSEMLTNFLEIARLIPLRT